MRQYISEDPNFGLLKVVIFLMKLGNAQNKDHLGTISSAVLHGEMTLLHNMKRIDSASLSDLIGKERGFF